MTENKPFELTINERGQADIIDYIESKKRDAICIYNDLGVPPYSSAKSVCNKLNEQSELINELKERNKRQYNRLKEITDLMTKRDWKTLNNMVDDWENAEELLQAEYGCYGDNV